MKYDLMLEINEDRSDDLGNNLTLGQLIDAIEENEPLLTGGSTLQICRCWS